MAWSTCPYCPIRLNGWDNMKRHQRKEHPTEYKISEVQKQVEWAEERLTGHVKDKEEYAILDSALDGLPPLAREILTKERDKRRVVWYLRGEAVITPFDEQIAEDTEWLAKKRAELAALQQPVTA